MILATLIEIPSWGNLTLIEALWLGSGLMALGFTTAHLHILWRDWQRERHAGRRVLAMLAGGYLRREVIRMLQGACLTSIGVYAALEPPALRGPAVVSVVGLVLTGVLLTLAILVSVQSHWDWHTRKAVEKLIAAGYNGD